jgi:prophage regulatory protein
MSSAEKGKEVEVQDVEPLEEVAEDFEPMDEGLRYVSVKYTARRFGVKPQTIWVWLREGRFPKSVKFGEHVTRWRISDLDEWERKQRSKAVNGN